MNLKLYPIATVEISEQNAVEQVGKLWQSVVDKLPKAARYGVYHNYTEHGCQYSIATELDLGSELVPINIDLSWHEHFPTNTELLGETWQHIIRKGKQGLLRRAFIVDFEQYQPDGRVDVFVSIVAHC